MKYLLNLGTGALDDVETPTLGEKFALKDDKLEEAIRELDNRFGPRTVIPASEVPQPENQYKDFDDRNPAANGGMMRQNFGDGTITPVKNLSKNITGNNLKLFNQGNLYTLRLGADKTQYFGTQKDLQTIFDARPTSGGDTTLELENKKTYKR